VSILDEREVILAMRMAWEEFHPGTTQAQEQGGFVRRSRSGEFFVERWPKGHQDQIEVPPHPNGIRGEAIIVASFHTHPNPPPHYQQEPSLTDIRAVRNDPDLRHSEYEGEYVVAHKRIFQIQPDGTVKIVGDTDTLLELG
jgi:hypothetical protein